jgi:TonB family protein
VINYYQKDTKVWSVDYFDLPVIPPDADAVKKLLERRRDKYFAEARSTSLLTRNGYPALEYQIRWGRDRVEIVRTVLVNQRVYELRALNQAKHADSEEVMKFFDSFKPAPMTDEDIAAATRAAREKVAPRKLKVSDGVLQGIAVKKVQPVYTPEAKAARVSGAAKIRVLISEGGYVIDAEVLECPDQLRESALAAARLWVFRPTELAGRPVKVEGILTLKFAPR